MGDIWSTVGQVAIVVTGLAAGGTFTVPLISRIKDIFNTKGWQTQLVAVGVSFIITLSAAVVEGIIAPDTITPETWGAVLLAVVTMTESRYRAIKDDLEIE